MKKRVVMLLVIIASVTMLSGCGPEKLIELNDDERAKIVSYSAHVISEFNKSQTEGYSNLNPEEIRNIEKQFKEEDDSKKDNATDNKNENSQAFTGGSATNDTDVDTTASEARFGDVYNVKGIKAKYNGYKVSSDYILDGVFSMNADKGNKYIIVSVKLKNNTNKDIDCNLYNAGYSYSLSVNDGEESVSAENTLLPNDLATYMDTVKAKKSAKAVLLFQVSDETANNINNMSVYVKNGNSSWKIRIN